MNQKLLISIKSLDELNLPADGYVLGYHKYTLFAEHYFSYDDLLKIKDKKKVYLLLNALINENRIKEVEDELIKLIDLEVNFIVSDFGLLNLLKKHVHGNEIILEPYTLISNELDYQTYQETFNVGLGISPFIKEEDLISMSKLEGSFIYALGYLPLYQSHRKIIGIYKDFHHLEVESEQLYLKEEYRDDLYPILENKEGSSVFKSSPISLLSSLNKYQNASYIYLDFMFINIDKSLVLNNLDNQEILKELELQMGVKDETY